jgi:ABC-type transporter Mla subunit MlaD
MRRPGVANNPILVGTGAVLVVLVMVTLSYNANEGLPFIPTYDVKARLDNGGANLVVGNDVRIGGARVGLVSQIVPRRDGEETYAEITMKLDKKLEEIPTDSWVVVRPRSTIGLKYVELHEGKSKEGIPPGGSITKSIRASEFDDLLNTMRPEVRNNYRKVLIEFGNTLAGRGGDINNAWAELNPLLDDVEPFFRMLSARSTGFERFLKALDRVAGDFAVVADQGGQVFVNADITFGAFAAAADGISETIAESPSALDTFTEEFPQQRPYINQLTAMSEAFSEGAPYLPTVADNMAVITVKGQPAMRHLYRTAPAFEENFRKFGEFAADPMVQLGLKNLTSFNRNLDTLLSFVTPSQTVCNYPGILVRNVAEAVNDRDGNVSWLRVGAVPPIGQPNTEFSPTAAPSDVFDGGINYNVLHSNPYPYTASPGQPKECAAGNEVTLGSTADKRFSISPQVTIGNPNGLNDARTEDTQAVDQGALQK